MAFSLNSIPRVKFAGYSYVTEAYMSFIENKMVQDIGFELKEQKDRYLLKIQDKQRYDCVLTCKCIINAGGKLELRKIKASPLRHLLIDLPCLSEDLDLRLMLLTKQIMEPFNVGEECNLKEIIESAIIDPNMNGGLRWSLGKDSAGERFLCTRNSSHGFQIFCWADSDAKAEASPLTIGGRQAYVEEKRPSSSRGK